MSNVYGYFCFPNHKTRPLLFQRKFKFICNKSIPLSLHGICTHVESFSLHSIRVPLPPKNLFVPFYSPLFNNTFIFYSSLMSKCISNQISSKFSGDLSNRKNAVESLNAFPKRFGTIIERPVARNTKSCVYVHIMSFRSKLLIKLFEKLLIDFMRPDYNRFEKSSCKSHRFTE